MLTLCGGYLFTTQVRGYTDINALPRRPFEIVDFERYAKKCHGFRWLLYCSSHGCPWDCSYCSNASVYGRNWKPLHADRTVDEMAHAWMNVVYLDDAEYNRLVERLAIEWGPRQVRALSLSPGMIDSPMARAEEEGAPRTDEGPIGTGDSEEALGAG